MAEGSTEKEKEEKKWKVGGGVYVCGGSMVSRAEPSMAQAGPKQKGKVKERRRES